jgi:hypothetical protein
VIEGNQTVGKSVPVLATRGYGLIWRDVEGYGGQEFQLHSFSASFFPLTVIQQDSFFAQHIA